MGKTTLIRAAAGVAQERGFRVRELDAGRPAEWGLPLHSDDPADALLALDRLGGGAPVLLVVDSAENAGRAALHGLTRIMRDACAEPVGLLLAARGSAPPPGLGAEIARYPVGPLDDCSAARLVSGRGPRKEILRRAAGNPLALLADEPPREFVDRVAALPAVTRRLLLRAALADEHLTVLNLAGGGSADLRDWQPAEVAGLVAIDDGRVRFGHPLIRTACLAVAAVELQEAYGDLAAMTGSPYYLALASEEPDESVASALEEQAGGRRDYVSEARALVASAERSPAPDDAARRYARAVVAAYRSGEPEWTLELHRRVAARTDDPDLLGFADAAAGLAMIHSGRPGEAFDVARHAAHRRPRDGQLVMAAVAVAANAALLTGVAAHREQLPGLLDLVTEGPVGGLGDSFLPVDANPVTRAWVLAVADPYASPRTLNEDGVLTGRAEVAWTLGTSMIAWLRDDSARAAAELSSLWQAGRSYGAIGALAVRVPPMILAMIDGGRWADAEQAIDEAETLAAAGDVSLLLTALPDLRATLGALRNDVVPVPSTSTGDAFTDGLRHRAAGLGALAGGDYEKAYWHFRGMFDVAGEPVHYFLGPRSLPQLAVAASGIGRRGRAQAQVRRILQGCRQRVGSTPTPRMAMLLSHAAALLDDGDETEEHFRRAVGDPDSAPQWPLELAEAQLNFALWLRKQRRVVEARPLLMAALDTFVRLGADAHAEQTRKYLPGGALLDDRPVTGDAFAALTAQKQTIARLAAGGMSNREIAGRLFLSPRTVGSHLYDIYPLLGVSNRHQLRALLAGAAS
ncbi:LuxR family transcriptional regulator [Actinoplanes solisilvae]|uniref:LuxR family transcriptional regulator n=1 Tax=Actinoplanes solisilvae TaxID=2486853 RepID=UPI001F0B8C7D|nr:LuxR family transcriptional regulator [Actinoplanes solisilvae]